MDRRFPEGADCPSCPLYTAGEGPVFPKINQNASLVIVGQEPGYEEVAEGEPFVGRSGALLNRSLDAFHISRQTDCHVTNALLCFPKRKLSTVEQKAAMVACRGRLHHELSLVRGRVVLGLGALALRTLTGHASIFSWFGGPQHGTSLAKKGTPGENADFSEWLVIPTIHPAFVLRSPAYGPVMQTHIQRAGLFAKGELTEWQWPHLELSPDRAITPLKRILQSTQLVALDVETAGVNPLKDVLRIVGLSDGTTTVSLPWNAYNEKRSGPVKSLWEYKNGEALYRLVKKILETKPLILQNGQHDITSIHSQTDIRIPFENYVFDTLLAHAVVAPRLGHYLDHIACVEFHMPMWKTIFGNTTDQKGGARYFNRPELETRDYNAKDALITALLYAPLSQRLRDEYRGEEQHANLLMKMKVAMKMTHRGIMVDPSRFASHRKYFMRKAAEAKRLLNEVAKTVGVSSVNPNAHAQCHAFFFQMLKVQPTKYSEETGRASLDEEALSALLYHQDERVKLAARGLLYFRRWDKLRGTYIDGLPYEDDGVVHAGWKVYGTRTGRWSSSPNLQNIPKPKYKTVAAAKHRKKCTLETGHEGPCKVIETPGLRDLFIARPGFTLCEADYKALELRIATLLSGDPVFLDNFTSGTDPHKDTAARVFGKVFSAVTKDERHMAKTANYQMIYGGSPIELWKKISIDFPNISLWAVEKFHDAWFDLHRVTYGWQQETIRNARRNGYVECPFSGRRQYYLDGQVDVNEVLNFPVQGTGSDIIDPALLKLAAMLDWKDEAIILQVHDALVCEAKDAKRMCHLLQETMTTTLTYQGRQMVFPVDVSTGCNWAEMRAVDGNFDEYDARPPEYTAPVPRRVKAKRRVK